MSKVISPDLCFVKEPIVLDKPAADFTAEARVSRPSRLDAWSTGYSTRLEFGRENIATNRFRGSV